MMYSHVVTSLKFLMFLININVTVMRCDLGDMTKYDKVNDVTNKRGIRFTHSHERSKSLTTFWK